MHSAVTLATQATHHFKCPTPLPPHAFCSHFSYTSYTSFPSFWITNKTVPGTIYQIPPTPAPPMLAAYTLAAHHLLHSETWTRQSQPLMPCWERWQKTAFTTCTAMLILADRHDKRQLSGPVQQCWCPADRHDERQLSGPVQQCWCLADTHDERQLSGPVQQCWCLADTHDERQLSGPVQRSWCLADKGDKRQLTGHVQQSWCDIHQCDLSDRTSNLRVSIQQTGVGLHHHLCQLSQCWHAGLSHPEHNHHTDLIAVCVPVCSVSHCTMHIIHVHARFCINTHTSHFVFKWEVVHRDRQCAVLQQMYCMCYVTCFAAILTRLTCFPVDWRFCSSSNILMNGRCVTCNVPWAPCWRPHSFWWPESPAKVETLTMILHRRGCPWRSHQGQQAERCRWCQCCSYTRSAVGPHWSARPLSGIYCTQTRNQFWLFRLHRLYTVQQQTPCRSNVCTPTVWQILHTDQETVLTVQTA